MPRTVIPVDWLGLTSLMVHLWGLALVTRGAYSSLCAGCEVSGGGRKFIIVGTLLLIAAATSPWSRSFRRAAAITVLPGAIAAIFAVLLPGTAFAVLAVAAVPAACSAAAAGLRPRSRRDRSWIVWGFLASATIGAMGTGLLAFGASATVAVCALLGPDPDRFTTPSFEFAVPDDISGL